ncbi:MAG: hypothetical protein IJ189_01055 [Clostridia bacterium]|nr:hypothetical protein [Clostridia bacterium]
MKKLLAFVLTLAMALSCIGALAENGVTAYSKATLNDQLFDMLAPMVVTEESDREMLPYIKNLINNLSVQIHATQEGGYLSYLLADEPVLTLLVQPTAEGGLALYTDLLPHYGISVSADTIAELKKSLTDEEMQAKMMEIIQAMLPYVQEYVTGIFSKAGEAEMGEFTFDGEAFAVKVPINITAQELVLLEARMIQNLAQEEHIAQALSAQGIDASMFDELIEQFEKQETWPELELAVYGNVNAETMDLDLKYMAAVIRAENQVISISCGEVRGQAALHFIMGDNGYATLEDMKAAASNGAEDVIAVDLFIVPGENAVGVELDVFTEMFLACVFQASGDENGATAQVAYYVTTAAAPLLTVDSKAQRTDAALPEFDVSDMRLIAIEDILAEMDGSEQPLIQALMNDLQNDGVAAVLSQASAALPDTVNPLVAMLGQRMAEDQQEDEEEDLPEMTDEEWEELLGQLFADAKIDKAEEEADADFSLDDLEGLLNLLMKELDGETETEPTKEIPAEEAPAAESQEDMTLLDIANLSDEDFDALWNQMSEEEQEALINTMSSFFEAFMEEANKYVETEQ